MNILNKILAHLIREYVRRKLHQDQGGFVPGIQGWFNIWKSFGIIHHINKIKKEIYMIMSTDAEKGLDKIQ